MKIISRAEWGARSPKGRDTVSWSSRTGVVVHHSGADDDQTVKEIQRYHMDTKGWSDIGYNFLVDKHGRLYEGRGWAVVGAHASGANTANIGICVIGDYDTRLPPAATLDALAWFYDEACRRKGKALAVRTHRMVGPTECPGDQLHAWVRAHLADEDYTDTPTTPANPTIEGGIMLPKKGDTGPDVGYWQRMLLAAGEKLPKYGVDDGYGDEMAAAVASWFKRYSGKTYHGRQITSWIAVHLQRQVFGGTPTAEQLAAAVAAYLKEHPPTLPSTITIDGGTLKGIKAA